MNRSEKTHFPEIVFYHQQNERDSIDRSFSSKIEDERRKTVGFFLTFCVGPKFDDKFSRFSCFIKLFCWSIREWEKSVDLIDWKWSDLSSMSLLYRSPWYKKRKIWEKKNCQRTFFVDRRVRSRWKVKEILLIVFNEINFGDAKSVNRINLDHHSTFFVQNETSIESRKTRKKDSDSSLIFSKQNKKNRRSFFDVFCSSNHKERNVRSTFGKIWRKKKGSS